MKKVIIIILVLLAVIIVGYGAAVTIPDPLAGKDNSKKTIDFAFQKIGINKPTWQTLVVVATREVDIPKEKLWERWSQLEQWPTWSTALHVSARWVNEPQWQAGAEFEQELNLGFPLGTMISTEKVDSVVPGEQVVWWKDKDGIKACHVWEFESLDGGRTRITNAEVFNGMAIGLIKPLVASNWQKKFDSGLDELIKQARQ